MEELEKYIMSIVAKAGGARTCYMEALRLKKKENDELCETKLDEGRRLYQEAHELHMELIKKEAQGEKVGGTLMAIHMENLIVAAEQTGILAEELIEIYNELFRKGKRDEKKI